MFFDMRYVKNGFFSFLYKKNQNFKNMWPFQVIAKMGPVAQAGASGPFGKKKNLQPGP